MCLEFYTKPLVKDFLILILNVLVILYYAFIAWFLTKILILIFVKKYWMIEYGPEYDVA